ncbi:MAG: hypothetical protein AAF340_11515 [Pseudomonadota bacterium]
MSVTPPEHPSAPKARRQPHSKAFLNRLEEARLRRAETLKTRQDKARSRSESPKAEADKDDEDKRPFRAALTLTRRPAVVAAFGSLRKKSLPAAPFILGAVKRVYWIVPIVVLFGLLAMALRGVSDESETFVQREQTRPSVSQLVSTQRIPVFPVRAVVSDVRGFSAVPNSAAILGMAGIDLFGGALENAPTVSQGARMAYAPSRPHLARLALPEGIGLALPTEPTTTDISEAVALVEQSSVQSGSSAERPLRVFVPNGASLAARNAMIDRITTELSPHVSPRDVAFEVSQSHIRVYAREDMEEAQRMAETLGFILRDMTAHEPKPPTGLIEIYVAGLPANAAPEVSRAVVEAETATTAGQSVATRTAIDQVLQDLAPAPSVVPAQPAPTGHVRPEVIFETEVLETSKPAPRRGLLGRLLQPNQ